MHLHLSRKLCWYNGLVSMLLCLPSASCTKARHVREPDIFSDNYWNLWYVTSRLIARRKTRHWALSLVGRASRPVSLCAGQGAKRHSLPHPIECRAPKENTLQTNYNKTFNLINQQGSHLKYFIWHSKTEEDHCYDQSHLCDSHFFL